MSYSHSLTLEIVPSPVFCANFSFPGDYGSSMANLSTTNTITLSSLFGMINFIGSTLWVPVFPFGPIVEDGSHAQLLAQNGTYARLWNRQVDGFMADRRR